MNYRFLVKYVGTDFSGFQAQSNGEGIQDHLERAGRTFLKHEVRIRGASRTDSGVHAEGQVACFRSDNPFDAWTWERAFNALVPATIGVSNLTVAPEDFDPISAAVAKAYRYRIWKGSCSDPFLRQFVWGLFPKVDASIIAAEAPALIGTYDFSSFCNQGSDAKTKVRTVYDLRVIDRGPMIDIWVLGSGFLKQMVRIMVGTLTDIAFGKMPRGHLPQLLAAQDRMAAGITAPAEGLCLVQIFYDRVPNLDQVIARAESGYAIALG